MIRTSNPAFGNKVFAERAVAEPAGAAMTINGTIYKTALLLAMVFVGALFSFRMFYSSGSQAVMPWMIGGIFGGAIFALITIFKAEWSPVTAPIYAVLEGLALGAISAFYNAAFAETYPSIVLHAVLLTFGVLAVMLALYMTGVIRATPAFVRGVIAATGAVVLVYVISLIMGMFGAEMPHLHSNGPIGIGISVVIVIIAALNLVLDFDLIERGSAYGMPKYMEWYAGFGLLVTLVWLYLEILRLLAKLNRR